MKGTAWIVTLCLAGVLGYGCDSPRDLAEPVPSVALPCASMVGDSWESVGWPPAPSTCDWFDYRRSTTFEFSHPLGAAPTIVIGYIAFEPDGSFSTVASGDTFLIEEVTADSITVRNGTDQNFYLRLVLQ